ncbi:MAG: hypothetical protein GY810_10110 [Aureispira sp.]|nr:hypothetical protein [Aureispira sp.]
MILRITLFYIILCSSCSSTENQSNNFEYQNNDSELIVNNSLEIMEPKKSFSNYIFEIPSASFFLDKKLTEVSSLAYDKEDHSFITNNDESGTIFTLRPESFKIKRKEKFAKKGDYEAIEKVGNTIILCESSGKLYFYDRVSKKTTTYKTELGIKNNVEGLCYEKESHSLLLACKAKPLDDDKDTKCVYQFDLTQKELITQPFLSISQNELKSLVKSTFADLSKSKLKDLKNRAAEFSPSGIAIHPKTGEYFLTSAKGSSLLILTKTKILKEIIFLDKKAMPQPEGLCFDKNNNLYISTEGQGSPGKILKFNSND